MKFSEQLINWYKENKRDLPWRKTKDPYIIWLSEIILQQTRVEQGLSYFNAFLEQFPTVNELADADESEVLKLWQGLGYYSRARNLHFTAKHISSDLQGIFPKDYETILKLKGVGEYTAAAIASFAYNLPHPVIDGNVYRVLSRVFGVTKAIDSTIGKKEFNKLAHELINKKNPAEYNQAIMEFGALYCKPKSPNCDDCMFKLSCFAYKKQKVDKLPFKEKKIKQRTRYFNYLVFLQDGNIYLNQRKEKDIWKGLFDFPLIETKQNVDDFSKLLEQEKRFFKGKINLLNKSEIYRHILSHQKINTVFWKIESSPNQDLDEKFLKINFNEINKYPVPKLIENYIKTLL